MSGTALLALFRASRWPPERLRALQLDRLRRLLQHARRDVPLYRRLYAGVAERCFAPRSAADLLQLPILEKKLLQEADEKEKTAVGFDRQRLHPCVTSGSSGEPLEILRTAFEERLLQAYRLRAFFAYGGRWHDHRAHVTWSGGGDHWQHVEPPKEPLWARLGLLRRTDLDCRKQDRDLIAELARLRPDVIGGYASSIAWLADSMTDEDRKRIRPRFLTLGGENLPPEMRQAIGSGFKAPVYDLYGAVEFNLLAWECPTSGLYHACDDALVLEVLKDGAPAQSGEEGEVVATALHSRAMPLIRFRTGDLAVRGPDSCPCGAGWSTLEALRGRTLERFEFADGRHLHFWAVSSPILGVAPFVRRYRLRQTSGDAVTMLVVPRRPPSEREIEAVLAQARDVLGPQVRFSLELVDQLPLGPAGKHQRFVGPSRVGTESTVEERAPGANPSTAE